MTSRRRSEDPPSSPAELPLDGQASRPRREDHDPYAALRVRDYRRLLSVLVLSGLGGEMQAVAVGWELYQRTHSAAALGLTGLAHFLPVLLLSLPAGHAADRYSRKRVLLVSLGLSVLASSGLAALSLVQGPIPLIYLCLALVGCACAFSAGPLVALAAAGAAALARQRRYLE